MSLNPRTKIFRTKPVSFSLDKVPTNLKNLWNLEFSRKKLFLRKSRRKPISREFQGETDGEYFLSGSLVCCHSKIFRNLFNNTIMHTMYPPGYHHNAFMAIPEHGHNMYGLFMVIQYF